MNRFQIASILEEEIEIYKNSLAASLKIPEKGYKINSAAWANNENELYTAYISYSRSPQEETIDLMIDVTLKQNIIVFDSGIYWSEGSLINEFESVELSFSNLNEIKNIVKDYFLKLNDKELKVYADTILKYY